jgi:RHS repeat-associated protein
VVLAQTWDDRRRLTGQRISAPGGLVHSAAFDYRSDDLLTGLTDSRDGERRFSLDVMGRVTAVRARDWSEEYAYDAAGDITRCAGDADRPAAGVREYQRGLLRRAGRTRFSRDASGRVIRREVRLLSGGSRVWEYGWTDGRLSSVTNPVGERWHYRYDAFDRRIAKERLDSDGSVVEAVRFAWDGTVLAEEHHTGRGATTTYEWAADSGLPVAQTTRAPGEGLSQETVNERFFAVVTDLVGAPTELVSEDGVSAWRSRTDLWGGPTGPATSAPTSVTCRLRFPGQYWDEESGLHYNYFRYYDPEVGRFLSPDPLGLDGGPNPHAYVPNPCAWIDPFGLALCRTVPRLEEGDLKQGWKHIDARHITGDHPSGPGDLMPPGTTREQVLKAASKAVRKGRRITPNPAKIMQTFEKKMTVNGFTATYRVSVDSTDGNRIVTFFPVGKSYT